MKAQVTQVHISNGVAIEGLMDTEGRFFVAVPQMVDLNLIPPNRSLKQLEALLGKELQSHEENEPLYGDNKIRPNFSMVKLKTSLHPKAVNAIPLD